MNKMCALKILRKQKKTLKSFQKKRKIEHEKITYIFHGGYDKINKI